MARRAAELADAPEAAAAGLTVLRAALDGERRGTALTVLAELAGLVGDTRRLWAAVTGTSAAGRDGRAQSGGDEPQTSAPPGD